MEPKIKLSAVHYRLLYQLFRAAQKSNILRGFIIEKLRTPETPFMMAETKKVRFRELNARFGICEFKRGSKSEYQFTRTPREILDLFSNCECREKLVEPVGE